MLKFLRIIIFVLVLGVMKDLLSTVMLYLLPGKQENIYFTFLLFHGNFFSTIFLYVPIIIFVSRKYKVKLLFELGKKNHKTMIFFGLLTFLIFMVVVPVLKPDFYSSIFNNGKILFRWFDISHAKKQGLLIFILMGVIMPILEELLFRGIILNLFLKKYSGLNAILLTSAVFSIYHLRLDGLGYLFVYGVIFGYAYYKTNSLTLPVLCHVIINLLAQVTTLEHIKISAATSPKIILFGATCFFLIVLLTTELNKGENSLQIDFNKLKGRLLQLISCPGRKTDK